MVVNVNIEFYCFIARIESSAKRYKSEELEIEFRKPKPPCHHLKLSKFLMRNNLRGISTKRHYKDLLM